tara:strand:- start:1651 stop:1962 length:312 start_codon:yes stop_codon:yes gene_type:complete
VQRIFKQLKYAFYSVFCGVVKTGRADRVVFYYPGEEGTYLEDVYVTLYKNGSLFLKSEFEEVSTHILNCEVIWNVKKEQKPVSTLRLLRLKKEQEKRPPESEL